MEVRPAGRVTRAREVQREKARLLMEVSANERRYGRLDFDGFGGDFDGGGGGHRVLASADDKLAALQLMSGRQADARVPRREHSGHIVRPMLECLRNQCFFNSIVFTAKRLFETFFSLL